MIYLLIISLSDLFQMLIDHLPFYFFEQFTVLLILHCLLLGIFPSVNWVNVFIIEEY